MEIYLLMESGTFLLMVFRKLCIVIFTDDQMDHPIHNFRIHFCLFIVCSHVIKGKRSIENRYFTEIKALTIRHTKLSTKACSFDI